MEAILNKSWKTSHWVIWLCESTSIIHEYASNRRSLLLKTKNENIVENNYSASYKVPKGEKLCLKNAVVFIDMESYIYTRFTAVEAILFSSI